VLRTPLCDLLGIEFPIIQAGMSRYTSADLVAAVSNAGALGSLGCDLRPVDDLVRQLALTRKLTRRPFAVNHLLSTLNDDAFSLTLEARPPVISFAGGDPGHLVKAAHQAGILVIQQVTTVRQACQAATRGVDVIIAQGSEAGGHGGPVAGLALIPQVVDAVHPIPVVAAGGIADGRGLAAALMLGAVGINIGTRFLASVEAPVSRGWKETILAAASEDAVRFGAWNHINPPSRSGGYGTALRAIRTPFIDHWQERHDEAKRHAERLRSEVQQAAHQGRFHELVPVAGQSAGLIRDVLPAEEIVRRMIAEARRALEHSQTLLTGT